MSRRSRSRRQHVSVRKRQRDVRRSQVSRAFRVLVLLSGISVLGALGVVQGGPILQSHLQSCMPQIEIHGVEAVRGLNLAPQLPANVLWLWLPVVGSRVESRILSAHPALAHAEIDRQWSERRIVFTLTMRQPLARVREKALDVDGIVYRPLAGDLTMLPQMELYGSAARPGLGRWIKAMRQHQTLWPKIASIREDRDGSLRLTLHSGLELLWGPPDADSVGAKAQVLFKVLEDSAQHFKGAARADLRFFSEGRIIVTPLKN